jgi:phage baseplate assembly protein W
MANSISVKFPFQRTEEGGVFEVNKTTNEAIRTNLISLLTTKRGHRVMRPNLYSPLFDYIMEPWDDISDSELREALLAKISEFMANQVEVAKINLDIQDDGNTLRVEIIYTVIQIGSTDGVELFVPLSQEN